MTVSSVIPSILEGARRALRDHRRPDAGHQTPLSFLCYSMIPFGLLGLAAVASRLLPDRMLGGDR